LGAPAITAGPLKTRGIGSAAVHLRVLPGHTYLIEVKERDKDALVEILDSKDQVIARADHPERRTGTRRSVVTASAPYVVVRVTGKEPEGAVGVANVRLFDLAMLHERPDCERAVAALAEADADYALAEDISAGRSTSTLNPRDEFLRAEDRYLAAEGALSGPGNQQLRGETALALAGIEYADLQKWSEAAQSARLAAGLLRSGDPYRWARADALLASAWMETGLPAQARNLLEQLRSFHLRRREDYDAALQLSNIGLAYYYEARFRECQATSEKASRLFGWIHEPLRRAQAWQNEALCLWGLGRLPDALREFERSLKDIGPEPYPTIYLNLLTNTALVNYALGRFDDSLRLYGRACAFAQKIQSQRSQANCLYGIGVNYYALGDRELAQQFLERSLAIRPVALDRRGRRASLRALATIYAEQGHVEQALAEDREALSLAATPPSLARIKIQLATHTAAAGHLTEARTQLDAVLKGEMKGDPTIQAEALLRRAVFLRQMGMTQEALADLEAARPRLRTYGSIMEQFEADLELARTQRMRGQPDAALRAVDDALAHADAVRLQTANPELRSQLQTPLRPAYDLKLELMWEKYEHAVAANQKQAADTLAGAAFATADASRAQTFADVAAQRYPPAVREALAPELGRREDLYRQLATLRSALDTRVDSAGSEDPRAKQLIADIGELEREVDTVNTVIASRTAGARARSGQNRANIPTLPAGTALVSYWLGSESAYAWVVLPGEVHWARLSAPAAVASKAMAFHRSLTRLVDVPLKDRLEDSRALYELIIRPLEPWLSNVTRWVIVPDGALDYVPFAALQTPHEAGIFVIMRHDIALTPAAWILDAGGTRARPHTRKALLMVADPVYQADDPRNAPVKPQPRSPQGEAKIPRDGVHGGYQRLPFSGKEAAEISALFPPGDVDQLIGLDATRERLLALDWSAYRFIHIATHGVVDAKVPQLSALILGSYDARGKVADDAVRVADISSKTLAADVVVLSGCETALGKEVRSEGLVGLSSTMLARGARAVVGSLWPVSDEIGERLMTDFYRHLLKDPLSPETALGAAMRAVASSRDRSADPAFWAAFQVSVAALGPLPGAGAAAVRLAPATTPREVPRSGNRSR
jgi:CHAT domain-containing protein